MDTNRQANLSASMLQRPRSYDKFSPWPGICHLHVIFNVINKRKYAFKHNTLMSYPTVTLTCCIARYILVCWRYRKTTGFIRLQMSCFQWWITGGMAVEDSGDCVGREDHRNRANSQPGTTDASVAIQSRGRSLQQPDCGRYRSHARRFLSVIVSATKYIPPKRSHCPQYMPTYIP